MSFASQKNDMLLRNMIYLLNANMIGSTDIEHDMFVFDERCSLFWPMFCCEIAEKCLHVTSGQPYCHVTILCMIRRPSDVVRDSSNRFAPSE